MGMKLVRRFLIYLQDFCRQCSVAAGCGCSKKCSSKSNTWRTTSSPSRASVTVQRAWGRPFLVHCAAPGHCAASVMSHDRGAQLLWRAHTFESTRSTKRLKQLDFSSDSCAATQLVDLVARSEEVLNGLSTDGSHFSTSSDKAGPHVLFAFLLVCSHQARSGQHPK